MTTNADILPPGRPTSFEERFIQEAHDYANGGYQSYSDAIPTVERFAKIIGVTKGTVYKWCKHNDDFMNAIDEIRQASKLELITNGLTGNYNSNFCRFLLSANHNMTEKTHTEHSSDGSFAPQQIILHAVSAEVEDELEDEHRPH